MAAPMLTANSVLAFCFKPCFHHKMGQNLITSGIQDLSKNKYHDNNDKSVNKSVKIEIQMLILIGIPAEELTFVKRLLLCIPVLNTAVYICQ